MANRSIDIERIPLVSTANDGKSHFLKVSVSYSKGGPNYFSGGTTPRGFYVNVSPIYTEPTSGAYTMEGTILGSGSRMLLEPAARFSDKVLTRLAATVKSHPSYDNLKASVLASAKRQVA
jgi:hypothetical protein